MRLTVAFVSLLTSMASAVVVNAEVVNVEAALNAAADFKCPTEMSYCPWTKACSCAPGLKLDLNSKKCVGSPLKGAWPEPNMDIYASKGVQLATYCAISPYKIAKYNPKHEYCQARLDTIAFVASAGIDLELSTLVDAEVDVKANISADLKAVCAGLAGLYLETVVDAVVLFNTDVFGLATVRDEVDTSISPSLLRTAQGIFCAVGLGECNYDCVSYCTKGCKNYIDVGAEIGAHINALAGLCILPNVLLIVNKAQIIVTVAVDGLLCLIGHLKAVVSLFGCNCH